MAIYIEKLPTGCKSMSASYYTIQFHDALSEEWTREEESNRNIWHKKMQEVNPNTSENYLLNSICVSDVY